MHRAAKDTGKYQHFLHKPFANGLLEHDAISTPNTAMFYTLLCCNGRVFWCFFQNCGSWGVSMFRKGTESPLPVQPEKLFYYVLFVYASKKDAIWKMILLKTSKNLCNRLCDSWLATCCPFLSNSTLLYIIAEQITTSSYSKKAYFIQILYSFHKCLLKVYYVQGNICFFFVNLWAYVHMWEWVFVYICIYMHAYTHRCLCVYLCACMCECIHVK